MLVISKTTLPETVRIQILPISNVFEPCNFCSWNSGLGRAEVGVTEELGEGTVLVIVVAKSRIIPIPVSIMCVLVWSPRTCDRLFGDENRFFQKVFRETAL